MMTVADVLKRALFRGAQIAAGSSGLDRTVRWVHVGEIPHLAQFLRGGELILATGVGLSSPEARSTFIQGLIESQAAGLVVELGAYLPEIPSDMVRTANQHHFPIIAFSQPVRFLDLSHDVNADIISAHYQVLEELESLSLAIRQALLNTRGAESLVEALYVVARQPVWYRSRREDHPDVLCGVWPELPPPPSTIQLSPVLEHRQARVWARQTVMVFDAPVGDLYVLESAPELDERLYLAMDRVSAALAQEFIRVDSWDKTRRRDQEVLLDALLFQEPMPASTVTRFNTRYGLPGSKRLRTGVFDVEAGTWLARQARRLGPDQELLYLAASDRLVAVLIAPSSHHLALLKTLASSLPKSPALHTGWSQPRDDAATIKDALSEAHHAWIVAHLPNQSAWCDYGQIGLYRWILATPKVDLDRLLINPELGPLLALPEHQRRPLLETLEAVTAHPGSKSSAAQSLGIHRQTLYARLNRLEALLGSDWNSASRHSAIQAALLARHFVETGWDG